MEIITAMKFFTRGESQIFTQPCLKINLNNLIDNYKTLCEIIAPATPAAVVKDDAYGLGAFEVAKALYEKMGFKVFNKKSFLKRGMYNMEFKLS